MCFSVQKPSTPRPIHVCVWPRGVAPIRPYSLCTALTLRVAVYSSCLTSPHQSSHRHVCCTWLQQRGCRVTSFGTYTCEYYCAETWETDHFCFYEFQILYSLREVICEVIRNFFHAHIIAGSGVKTAVFSSKALQIGWGVCWYNNLDIILFRKIFFLGVADGRDRQLQMCSRHTVGGMGGEAFEGG